MLQSPGLVFNMAYHWKVTTAETMKLWNNKLKLLLRRARPPYNSPMPGMMSQTMKAQKIK